jgi:hypothetical protein
MQTSAEAALAALTPRQLRSVDALQRNVNKARSSHSLVKVTTAQYEAMQAAYTAAKASGQPIPPEAHAAAARMGLK